MRKLVIGLLVILMGCSSAELVSTWKNPEIVIFDAYKVLVVGMTPNKKAQQNFETKMVQEFTQRNIEAMRSIDLFDVAFTEASKSEAELDDVEEQLLDKDFDAILFTKILGTENRETFSQKLAEIERTNERFKDDYMSHQDIYYDDNYYDQYTVYLVETSLYCICVGKERELIWRGVIEITDPIVVNKTIETYIGLVVEEMERQELIFRQEDM
ncbi:MAG: hypothetical protein HKN52_03705 [Eudoraea sp.]|nr:hypothetical protein [Eudoraea sp.]